MPTDPAVYCSMIRLPTHCAFMCVPTSTQHTPACLLKEGAYSRSFCIAGLRSLLTFFITTLEFNHLCCIQITILLTYSMAKS